MADGCAILSTTFDGNEAKGRWNQRQKGVDEKKGKRVSGIIFKLSTTRNPTFPDEKSRNINEW